MTNPSPEFSPSQWEFLATVEAFGAPLSMEVAGTLSPLLPGPLIDLLGRAEELGWVRQLKRGLVGLAPDVPPEVLRKLKEINTQARLSALADQLRKTDLVDELEPEVWVNLLHRAGLHREATSIKIDLVQGALENRDVNSAIDYLKEIVQQKRNTLVKWGLGASFAGKVLDLSHLCWARGKGMNTVPALLEEAMKVAKRLGDSRCQALINLHLGRLLYFRDRRPEAMTFLSRGRKMVERLGDDDILVQSGEFLGLYFFMQGDFRKTLEHFEWAADPVHEEEANAFAPLTPFFMGLSAFYLGLLPRAIGIIDNAYRHAEFRSDESLAAFYKALLGHVLVSSNKRQEGRGHLLQALSDATAADNALARFLAEGTLAYERFLDGEVKQARDTLAEALARMDRLGIVQQYGSTAWILEMLFEFDRVGHESVPNFTFESQAAKIMREPNIHLRGVAERLLARRAATRAEPRTKIESGLKASEHYLLRSGDPVQLAKTRLEMVRMELGTGDRARARELAGKIWQDLPEFAKEIFPDNLRYLLESTEAPPLLERYSSQESTLSRFWEVMEWIAPCEDLDRILDRALDATTRLFGAERGGLFVFDKEDKRTRPVLRAACNITEGQTGSKSFRRSMELIRRAFQQNRPMVLRPSYPGRCRQRQRVRAILCIPFQVGSELRGVLYYDNSYLEEGFESPKEPLLMRLTQHLGTHVERMWKCGRLTAAEEDRGPARAAEPGGGAIGEYMIRESSAMVDLMADAEKIAGSESVVLIQGETGVGKELLARWIHSISQHREGPFLVIDVTTIPESLLEGELFGHEKGAFTGADRRKTGRIELAHQGTLFLDEVGELPLSLQAKLLRVFEEKQFVRIGGTRILTADFRLLAATNRNLKEEVAKGRFRQDLYYRLNVVPIFIPPLRERREDVIPLARHFVENYAKTMNRPALRLTPADEERLQAYLWPGNVRELRNVIERGVLLSAGDRLELILPADAGFSEMDPFADKPTMDELQRRYIQHVLSMTGGRISGKGGAADILGMNRRTLYHRMNKLGLS